jgi:ABC-type transport system involved in multi-copper enzyme maturation permease subunit
MTALAAFSLLIAPMTIVTFARQIAGEDSRGTLRMILARPIGRFALINAKFTVGAAATALLMGFFFTLSYGMGLMLFKPQLSITVPQMRALDFDEIDPEYREFERTAREEARSRGRRGRFGPREVDWRSSIQGRIIQMRISAELERTLITPMEGVKRLAFVWLLSTWALLTLGSIAFFYSSLTKHSIAAMAMTLGTYFLVMILQGLASADNVIPLFETIEPYLFTTEMDVFTHALAAEIGPEEKREIRRGVRLLGAYTLIFYAATQFIFWRKDITS